MCFSLDLEFRNALPLALPIRLLSLSLAPIWSRASRDSRAAPGCCERSSEAPVRWQPFLRSRVPSAVGATRLGSEKIAEDREWLLPAFGNTVLQISSLRTLHKRNGRSRPFKLFEKIEITSLISFQKPDDRATIAKSSRKIASATIRSTNLNLRKFDFH